MKIGVRIMPRNEVLDTQGRAVEKTLGHHDFKVRCCRVGRYVEIDLDESDERRGLDQAQKMTEFVLHNPLIERYELEVIHEK